MNKSIKLTKDIIKNSRGRLCFLRKNAVKCKNAQISEVLEKKNLMPKTTIYCNFLLTRPQDIVIIVSKRLKGRHFV